MFIMDMDMDMNMEIMFISFGISTLRQAASWKYRLVWPQLCPTGR